MAPRAESAKQCGHIGHHRAELHRWVGIGQLVEQLIAAVLVDRGAQ